MNEPKEWILEQNAPKQQGDGCNFHDRHKRVKTRVLLYDVLDLVNEDTEDDTERAKCFRFYVVLHQIVSPMLHQHCNPQSLRETWKTLKTIEPRTIEAETDLLLQAFGTKLQGTDFDTFIKTHTAVQAKLHRLNPDVQSATNLHTYHRIIACSFGVPSIAHITQVARSNRTPKPRGPPQSYLRASKSGGWTRGGRRHHNQSDQMPLLCHQWPQHRRLAQTEAVPCSWPSIKQTKCSSQ